MEEAMRNRDSVIKRNSVQLIVMIQMQYICHMMDLGFLMLSLHMYVNLFFNFGSYQAIDQCHFITIIKGFITCSHTGRVINRDLLLARLSSYVASLVWPWPWPWPRIFKVKYRICHVSPKNGPIATKRKANISIELQASNLTNWFDVDHNLDLWILKVMTHDLDHWFSWSNFDIAVSRNRRADWHCTKGVAVSHSWPWPWPFGDQGQVYGSTR